METHTTKQKRDIAEKANELGITLDGTPASIKGIKRAFGFVCTDQLPQGVEFCWETIERIVNSHRQFNS